MDRRQRSMAAMRSRASGNAFEELVLCACDFYYRQGVAVIEKTPEPMRPLGRPDRAGRFTACYVKQAQPDFKGALCDGTCIIFDAKHTDKDRLRQSAVTEAQQEAFERYGKMGARCYVVASVRMEKFYRVPWSAWRSMKETYGHKYMSEEELEPYILKTNGGTVLILDGIELRDADD